MRNLPFVTQPSKLEHLVSGRSGHATLLHSHNRRCKCGQLLQVDEYKEPATSDSGKLYLTCRCSNILDFNLRTNVEGAEYSGAVSHTVVYTSFQ